MCVTIRSTEPAPRPEGQRQIAADFPQAAIAWSGGVTTSLKSDVQATSLIGLGSGESFQIGFLGRAAYSSSPQRASSRSAEA